MRIGARTSAARRAFPRPYLQACLQNLTKVAWFVRYGSLRRAERRISNVRRMNILHIVPLAGASPVPAIESPFGKRPAKLRQCRYCANQLFGATRPYQFARSWRLSVCGQPEYQAADNAVSVFPNAPKERFELFGSQLCRQIVTRFYPLVGVTTCLFVRCAVSSFLRILWEHRDDRCGLGR